MTTATRPQFVEARIDHEGKVWCECGRLIMEVPDASLLAIMHEHGVRLYIGPACKGCRQRASVDFGIVVDSA